jgi:tetratricopeptide (TPR) repeat protein
MRAMVHPPLPRSCFALVQVAEEAALRARLPTAVDRGRVVVEEAVRAAAAARGGTLHPSVARGWFVQFESVDDAVWFSADLQWLLLAGAWAPTLLVRTEAAELRDAEGRLLYRGLRVRTVIHCGRVDAGIDGRISGPGLYHAARILAVTHGGQVLLSDAAHQRIQVDGAAFSVRELGPVPLVGSDGVGPLTQVLPIGLAAREFPEILAVPTTNLLTQEESTLGRDGDVQAVLSLVRMGIRLVTVVGPSGVGKSRTCRLTARALHREGFPGGVWWVRPGEATVSSLVRCLSTVLSVPLEDALSIEEATARIGYALAARDRLVVVIDHLAHRQRSSQVDGLSRDLRAVLAQWLRVSARSTFVVNTDVRFGIPGEVLYVLLPLVSNREDSVRLFLDRARAVDEDVQTQDPSAVAELVERSGGLPLSIRLLAGVVDRFPVERQLDWFRSGDLSEDRILAVVLDQLDEAEREALAACCALPGSFEPGLVASEEPEASFVLLERLDRRGLVRRAHEPEAPEVLRYIVEENVRRRVLEALPVEEHRVVRDVRAQLLLNRCESWLGIQYERDRTELVARLAVEWEGLVEVIRIGLEESREDIEAVSLAARAVLTLRPVLEARGPAWVAAELLDAVCRRMDVMLDADAGIHLRVLLQRAQALRRVGRTASAFGDLERAEAMGERWSDRAGQAQCAVEAGRAEYEVGSSERAMSRLEEGARLFREIGDLGGEAVAYTYLGAVQMAVGRYSESTQTLSTAVAGLRAHDLRLHECRAIGYLAMLYRRLDDADASRRLYAEAITLARECGIASQESRWLAELGLLDLNLDRVDDARTALAEAARVARRAGDRAAEGVVLRDLGLVALVAGDYEEAARVLLGAVAVHRDRGEAGAEGADTALLACVHHLQGRLDEARSAYLAATALVEQFGDARLAALFAAWLAACEAERGDQASATAALDLARLRQLNSGDPQVGETVELLALLVLSCELDARPELPERLALVRRGQEVRAHMESRGQVPAFPRLAWRRLTTRPGFGAE